MTGAEAAQRAARQGDEVAHGFGLLGMVAGALIGAVLGALIIAGTVATGGLLAFAIVGGCIAGGGLAGGAIVRGVMKAANLSDPTTGTLGFGSSNVLVNGRLAQRAGMDSASVCDGLKGFNHPRLPMVKVAEGARTVLVNGCPMGRVSSKLVCGAKIKAGSENVQVGGDTARVLTVIDSEEIFETALEILGVLAFGAGAAVAAMAGALALGVFAASTVALDFGFGQLKEWADTQLGDGWGDILTGVATFALMGLGAKWARNRAAKNSELGDQGRPKEVATCERDPVDVATGRVMADDVDFEIAGPLPLEWQRSWDSTSTYKGPIGHGWHHSYDLALMEVEGAVVVRLADGRAIAFPWLEDGDAYFDRKERLTLLRDSGGYRLKARTGLVHRFVPAQTQARYALESLEDRSGHRICFEYGSSGTLTRIIDSSGRAFDVSPDAGGRISSIAGPDPTDETRSRVFVRYGYDDDGNLVQITDALGETTRIEYARHLRTRETDRNGLSFYWEYDGADETARCVRTWGDGGIYAGQFTYDLEAGITTLEDSLGHRTVYHHRDGLVYRTIDALGNETRKTYGEDDELLAEVDGLGRATLYEYDDRGNPIRVTGPDGAKTEVVYDGDLVVAATGAMGEKWSWRYDERGRVAERTDPLGQKTQMHYKGPFLSSITDASGRETAFSYDRHGNLAWAIAPDGSVRRWEYDALGRCICAVDPKRNEERTTFDLLGRSLEVSEPDGNLRQFEYDGSGNLVHVRDRHRDVRLQYAGLNRLVARTEAGTTVQFAYDTEQRLIGIHNEHGCVYRFELGPTGEVDVESGFDGIRRKYWRDAAGQVVTLERASGITTEYSYDPAGRVVSAKHSDGTAERYQYRLDGTMAAAGNSAGTVKFERDLLGRIIREYQGEHWVDSAYDASGLRSTMRSSLGAEQTIQRNAMGDVLGLQAGDFAATFERDEFGLETHRILSGGVHAEWHRDRLGRPIEQVMRSPLETPVKRDYTWDVGGRLLQIVRSERGRATTTRYSHDARGTLVAAQHSSLHSVELELRMPDAVGNLFRTEDRSDRRYGPAGQLLETLGPNGSTLYEYDADGNLSRKLEPGNRESRYQWNATGMLASVVRPDGTVVEFGYDALGRRLWKKHCGRTTRWVWDGNNPLHEWVENNEGDQNDSAPCSEPELQPGTKSEPITWLFDPESFSPIAKLVGKSRFGVVTDHLGTPVGMYDALGRSVWSAEMGIYGQLREQHGSLNACPFRWPGQYEDAETGLYYNRFRYYDPEAGEYVSQDPIGLAGGLRVHAYPGDPLGGVDPLGLVCGDASAAKGAPEAKARFISQPDGTLVDTQATPRGSYKQPNGGRTDILQQEDHGAGLSHTHDPKVNVNLKTRQTFVNGLEKPGRPVSAADVENIISGRAGPAEPKGR